MLHKLTGRWKGLIIPLAILALWISLGAMGKLNSTLFPGPGDVGRAFLALMREGRLSTHVIHSLQRIFLGFGFAAAIGVPMGLVLGCFPGSQVWFGPMIHFLRHIPPTAWVPVFLLWFGIGQGPKLAVIFYASVFPVVINTALGVQQIPWEYWEVSHALCLSPWRVLRALVLPGSLPAIFTGLRLGMGISWRAIVAAEMLASTSGLGFLVMSSRALVRVDEMFAGIMVIGILGVTVDFLFAFLQKRVVPSWEWTDVKAGGGNHGKISSTVGSYFQDI